MSVLKTYGGEGGFHPSKTYRLENGRIQGGVDGLEAVRQAAALALGTERFEHLIYSADYGSELHRLIGKRRALVRVELERMIRETLKQDDRIEDIADFAVAFRGETTSVAFRVLTVFGEFEMERSFGLGGAI